MQHSNCGFEQVGRSPAGRPPFVARVRTVFQPLVCRRRALSCVNQVVEMWENEVGGKEMKCQWFYRPAECAHESLGANPGATLDASTMKLRPGRHSRPSGREFMHLHSQEVFLTIHDDPNPISTIVSGALSPISPSDLQIIPFSSTSLTFCFPSSFLRVSLTFFLVSGCVVLLCNEHKLCVRFLLLWKFASLCEYLFVTVSLLHYVCKTLHVALVAVNPAYAHVPLHLRAPFQPCNSLCMWREWSKKVPLDRLFFYARQFFPENGTFYNILRGHVLEVTRDVMWDAFSIEAHDYALQPLPLAVVSPQTFSSDLDGESKEDVKVSVGAVPHIFLLLATATHVVSSGAARTPACHRSSLSFRRSSPSASPVNY